MSLTSTPKRYDEPWLNFKHAIVRQLAFSVASPNLIRTLPIELTIKHPFELHPDLFWQSHFFQYLPRLIELDQNPNELVSFLQRLKSTRLGLRFESLLWFWLLDEKYHSFQLLGHSVQKIDGANTLGELDFLILNTTTNEIEHWEVALKYYLGEENLDLPHWEGLNREDTFHKKLKHFTEKQFQFSDALGKIIQRRYAVIKGQLYLPLDTPTYPSWINPTRQLGYWGDQIPQGNFYRLQRIEWLCPNQQPSSKAAYWWTNGLYYNSEPSTFFMFRNRQQKLVYEHHMIRNN